MLHRNCRRIVLRFGKWIYLKLGKISCSFTSSNIATLILSDKVSSFHHIKIKCACTINKRNLEKNNLQFQRLIKTVTKFSNVIGYHQTDLGTYNIHEKITRVWLAENGCIFHVTRVQSCNTSTNYNKHARCQNFVRLRCVFRINYQQEATWFLVRYGVTKHL